MLLGVLAQNLVVTDLGRLQALLGMLGKLKRTLTQNLSEQKRTTDDQGNILLAVMHTLTQPAVRKLQPTCLCPRILHQSPCSSLQHQCFCFLTGGEHCTAHVMCNTILLHVTGYIAAANIRSSVTDDVPNLLRPSPGLEYLSEGKLALPTDEAVDRYTQACYRQSFSILQCLTVHNLESLVSSSQCEICDSRDA